MERFVITVNRQFASHGREIDGMRDSYSMEYSGYFAEDKEYKDILIGSNTMGVEAAAQYLAVAARIKFGL